MKYIKYLLKLLIIQSFFILFILYIGKPISIGIYNNIVNYNNIVLLLASYIAISYTIIYYINCIILFNIDNDISYSLYRGLFTLKISDNYKLILFIIAALILSRFIIPLFLMLLLVILVGKCVYSYVEMALYKNTDYKKSKSYSYFTCLKDSFIFIFKYIAITLVIIYVIYMIGYLLVYLNTTYKYLDIYMLDIFMFFNKYLFIPLYLYHVHNYFIKDKNSIVLTTPQLVYIILFICISSNYIYIISKDEIINNHTTIIAHRGDSMKHTENTKDAILSAINNNIEYIEIDVMNTKDNVTVIHHDKTTKRLSNTNKKIAKTVYDKLENEQYTIPTLEDILAITQNKVKLLIELKGNKDKKLLVESVINLVYKYNMQDDVIITSLNYEMINEVMKQDSKIKTGFITYNYSTCHNSDYLLINKNCINNSPLKGNILLWTVNTKKEIEGALKEGVSYIISDDIALCKRLIYEHLINATNSSKMFEEKLLVHFVNY